MNRLSELDIERMKEEHKQVSMAVGNVVYVLKEKNEVVFVGLSEKGVFGVDNKSDEVTDIDIYSGFKNLEEAKKFQNDLIIEYEPIFNIKLNDYAITFRTLLKHLKIQRYKKYGKGLDIRTFRKALKKLNVQSIVYGGVSYIPYSGVALVCENYGVEVLKPTTSLYNIGVTSLKSQEKC